MTDIDAPCTAEYHFSAASLPSFEEGSSSSISNGLMGSFLIPSPNSASSGAPKTIDSPPIVKIWLFHLMSLVLSLTVIGVKKEEAGEVLSKRFD